MSTGEELVIPDFSQYIKNFRHKHGYTIAKMADMIGVKYVTYRNWERGLAKPGTRTLGLAYAFYGDDVVHLADRPGDSKNLRIKKAWLRTGLDIHEIAPKINFAIRSINNWNAGKHEIREENFMCVMKALREIENENRKNRG